VIKIHYLFEILCSDSHYYSLHLHHPQFYKKNFNWHTLVSYWLLSQIWSASISTQQASPNQHPEFFQSSQKYSGLHQNFIHTPEFIPTPEIIHTPEIIPTLHNTQNKNELMSKIVFHELYS